MNKIIKISLFVFLIFICLSQLNIALAVNSSATGSSINPEEWNPAVYRDNTGKNELDTRAEVIIGVIRRAGMVVSVITLMVIGIREMTASIEEKTIIKQSMPGYILGAILVFAITLIPTIVYNWAKEL